MFCFSKFSICLDLNRLQYLSNATLWKIRCDPRNELTPTNIFHYSESFASSKQIEMHFSHSKHWFPFQIAQYLSQSYFRPYIYAIYIHVHPIVSRQKSHFFRRPFARAIRKKKENGTIFFNLSISFAVANGSFLGFENLQICLLKLGMKRLKEGLYEKNCPRVLVSLHTKKSPSWDGRKPPSLKTMAME